MRAVTFNAVQAFNANKKFKQSNTEVTISPDEHGVATCLWLHGNMIAHKYTNIEGLSYLSISACGWLTPTTKERLNGLDGVSIYQRKGVWYLNGKEWGGLRVDLEGWNEGRYAEGYATEGLYI
jgi:hypothetical protein